MALLSKPLSGVEMAVLPTVLPRWGQAAANRRVVLVFTIYLDDSGTHGSSRAIVCAGYVAPLALWGRYERAAAKIYKAAKITEFHAKDFNRPEGQFKGWSFVKQTAFVHNLVVAAKDIGCVGVTNAVHKAQHSMRKKESRKLDPQTSSYARAFLGVIDRIQNDRELGPLVKKDGLSIVIECGNKNDENISREFKKLQARPDHAWLKSIGMVKKSDSHAIQFADFIAYYSWKHVNEWVLLNPPGGAYQKPQMNAFMYHAKEEIRTIGNLAEDFILRLSDA